MSLYSRLDRLAADQDRLERKFDALANSPQAQRTSVEGGSIDFNDSDGNLKAIVGEQDDGGTTVNVVSGPTPPTPANFTVSTDHGKIMVHWDGEFENGAVAPSDWGHWSVYAQEGQFVAPSRETDRGGGKAASGGEVSIGVLKGQWTVTMLAWSQAGKRSEMAAPVTVDVPGYGDIVLEEIDAATTLIKNAGEMLLEGQQTLADKLAGIADLDPEEISDEIAQARQEAIDAALAEIANVEGTLTSAIGGKSTTKWSTSNPPADYDGAVGDTWVKLTSLGSGGREIRRSRWQGDVWVDHPVDGAVLSNVDASTITTGFLDVVNRIRAGAILADKLLIGGPTNLIPSNPDPTVVDFPYLTYDASEKALRAEGKGTHYTEAEFTLPAGKYLMSADLKASVAGTTCYVGIYAPTPRWAYGINNQTLTTDWVTYSGIIEVGESRAGVPHVIRYLPAYAGDSTAVTWMKNLSLRSMVGGTLITPGGIETPHLAADVLEVGNFKAGTAALAEAVIKKLFAEVVVARMAQAEEFIGENAILTGAVTAPKITASEELWAKLAQFVKIRTEQLEADAIDGMFIRGTTFETPNGSRWSNAGLFLNDQDGNPRIQAPTDGSDFTVNAEIVAKSLTATGRASFLSTNNRLEPGAELVLASGVGDPPSPPVVSTYYPTIKAPLQDTDRGAYGLAWADGHFWRWVENESATGNRGRVEKITTAGSVVASFDTGDFLARNGAVGIGTELFLLGPKTGRNDKRWVQVYGTDGVLKREWQYTFHVSTTKYQPGIGRDEDGNVVIAHCWSDTGALTWRTFDNTGNLKATFDSPDKTRSDINGIYVGSADFGVERAVIAKVAGSGGARQFPAFNTTTGVYVLDDSWHSPGREESKGIVWDGNRFHSISADGTISDYSTLSTGGDGVTSDWWAVYRWAKGALSSRISPPARFVWPRRSMLRLTAPNLPLGVDGIAPALARKATTPVRTDFHTPTWQSATGTPTAIYSVLPTNWLTTPVPADSNNFPNGAPSSLTASSGTFEVRGDGSGRWGPLVFNADGTMSSTAVPAWVPITTFESGFGPQSWGDVPGYRIWPDGKVEWRGVIAGTMTAGGGRAVLTIPAVARPGRPKNKTGTSNSATSNIRVEFGPTSDPSKLYVYPYGENRAWVSIDELYYYLT